MGFLDISSVVQGILGCTGLFVVASGLFLFKYQTSLIYPVRDIFNEMEIRRVLNWEC